MFVALQGLLKQTTAFAPVAARGNLLERRRLIVLFAIALFKLLNFFGGNWDIQWHISVGRDSLFIPPHLMVMVAFGGGIILAWVWLFYEALNARNNRRTYVSLTHAMLQAPPAFLGVIAGYSGALMSAMFDEWWHEQFGLDATLWSPPHLCIMASTMLVDYSLMIGITAQARRLGSKFDGRNALFWGLGLTGAYLFEAVNFQMSQAFLESFRANGAGLMGLLFPLMVGALFPMPMLLAITLAKRFRVVWVLFSIAIILQITGIGIASAGFAILQPTSDILDFVRLNPDSSIAKAREFTMQIGFGGWAGIQQTWALALSAVPLALVAFLDLIPWARKHPLIAAPLYSGSLMIVSYLGFQQLPVLREYDIMFSDLALATLLVMLIGLLAGYLGLRLGNVVSHIPSEEDVDRRIPVR